jgi:acylphosphatase
MLKTISITVSGKVQGVFYRQSTIKKAESLRLKGFVKNMPDETVYIVATGQPEDLDELVKWCRQGPPRARVTNAEVNELSLSIFPSFTIER